MAMDQAGVAPEQAPQQAQPQSGGGVMQKVQALNDGLIELAQMFEQAGAPEQVLNQLAGVVKNFQTTVSTAIEGKGQEQQQVPQGNVSMEEGASAGARQAV